MLTFNNTSHDPFYNQAFEEYVFDTFREDDMLFLWRNSPAVVVGCSQNICREVSVPALRRSHIPVVRRISGGGTVYHDLGNINYTYIKSVDGLPDYGDCIRPVTEALNSLGIPAHQNGVCDIAIADKKISGSAQRVVKDRVLHHGTLLYSCDLGVLDGLTTFGKNDCFKTKGTLSAISSVANISDYIKNPMSVEDFRSALAEKLLPSDCKTVELTAEQATEVEKLRDEKYKSREWTWGTTPPFVYEKTGVYRDEPIYVSYKAKKGVVSDAMVESPWLDGALASALMNGSFLCPEVFEDICLKLSDDENGELFSLFM